MKSIQSVLLAVFLVASLAGCGSTEKTVTGSDRDAVLAFSEAMTDNLLAGMNASDYAAFSRDFDEEMLKAMPRTEFDKLKKDRDAKLGLYLSREVDAVVQHGEFFIVIYEARFEKDDAVKVRVVYRMAEPHPISGLWFNK